MREFGIAFAKGLANGLRYTENPRYDEEWLIECYNLMPSEGGLVPFEPATPLGFAVVWLEYLRIRAQDGTTWYWMAGRDGALEVSLVQPNIPGFDMVDITPATVPYFITILDQDDDLWYLYPDSITGQVILHNVVPGVGTGLTNFKILCLDAITWGYEADNTMPSYGPVRRNRI